MYLNGQTVLNIDKIADEPDATNNNESGCVGVGIEDAEKRVDAREVKRGGVEDRRDGGE